MIMKIMSAVVVLCGNKIFFSPAGKSGHFVLGKPTETHSNYPSTTGNSSIIKKKKKKIKNVQ